MCLKNNQNVGNMLLFVVNHVGVKMARVSCSEYGEPFSFSKNWGRPKNQSCCKGVFLSELPTKTK